MKRITALVSFFVLFLTAGMAQEVVLNVTHTANGAIQTEINDALTVAGLTVEQVEKLVVTSNLEAEIYFNLTDCRAVGDMFITTTFKTLDLSGTKFYQNATPDTGSGYVFAGTSTNFKGETIILPPTTTQIRKRAFFKCSYLKNVVLPTAITEIRDYAFADCPELINIGGELPASLTTLGLQVFRNCPKFVITTIPSGVTAFPSQGVFLNTGITEMTFPATLVSFGNKIFENCALTYLQFNGTTAPTVVNDGTNDTFLGVTLSNVELCYPSGSTGFDVSPWSDMKTCVSTSIEQSNVTPVNLKSAMVTDVLRFGSVAQDTEAYIYNTNGKLVCRVKLHANQSENTISVVNLAKGFYFLKTNQSTLKFIKN
ncbi:MAG: leucine-rich repeat protein [Paludibacter sp.]|nr:leucine-rich repeat protein [Paludibacter sp.]